MNATTSSWGSGAGRNHEDRCAGADGCQDPEYFLPKIEIEKVGVATEVISLTRAPVFSFFTRIGLLDVQKTVDGWILPTTRAS